MLMRCHNFPSLGDTSVGIRHSRPLAALPISSVITTSEIMKSPQCNVRSYSSLECPELTSHLRRTFSQSSSKTRGVRVETRVDGSRRSAVSAQARLIITNHNFSVNCSIMTDYNSGSNARRAPSASSRMERTWIDRSRLCHKSKPPFDHGSTHRFHVSPASSFRIMEPLSASLSRGLRRTHRRKSKSPRNVRILFSCANC